jgi:hypothetical protein
MSVGVLLDTAVAIAMYGKDIPPGWAEGDVDPPPYSTDIGAAWAVVEWLTALWRGGFHLDREGSAGWECASEDAYCRTHMKYVGGTGATAPEAICRAALVAKAAA